MEQERFSSVKVIYGGMERSSWRKLRRRQFHPSKPSFQDAKPSFCSTMLKLTGNMPIILYRSQN